VLAALRDSSAANRESESPQPERHAERGRQLAHLTGMCTAMRVCLMKHLAIEDTELWPLFNVYFTVAEQQSVIGAIVGRSSAEVLQVMLPLIQAETTRKEEEEMLSSISLVTKNTNFDSWLKTWFVNPAEASASTDGAASADVVAASAAKSKMGAVQMQQQRAEEMEGRLADMARYLEPAPEVASAPSQVDASRGDELVVSWHNVFHLNQTQLQSAVLRVSRDEGLEPKRKAYLMQNLFTVRWLIAQQQGGAADKPSAVLSPSVDSSSASAPALTAAESSTTLPPPLPPPPPPPPDDGSPSALPRPVMHETHSVTSWHRQADSVLGCSHYARKAQLVAGCCQKVVPCRLCHDEQDTTHMLDRAATTHMVRSSVCLRLSQPVGVRVRARVCL
jgi:zinc finger-like protein